MSPFCFSPSPFSSSFSLLLSSFLSFSSPRFPLVPVLCFWFGFCVCVFGGGGLWCGVLCGGGLRLAWVWFVVFDVGVVWMGGSVLGPVWVRVCLAVCAFVCFPFVFWWGVLRVIDKKTRATRQADTHTERALRTPSARTMLHAAWACARCTPIYSRRRTTNAHSTFRIRSSSSSVAAPTQPLGSSLWLSSAPRPRLRPN